MIKSLIRQGTSLVLVLTNGRTFETNNCTNDFYKAIMIICTSNMDVEDRLDNIFYPNKQKNKEAAETYNSSAILTMKNGSAYIPAISSLTVPKLLADKIIEAEKNNNQDALTAYKNFWTLLSLNPNSAVRDNLFWFLNKWGMSICKSGLFVAYRNVELKQEGTKYNAIITALVSKSYNQIKQSGFDPNDYLVVSRNDNYEIISSPTEDDIILGTLQELYDNMIFCSDKAGTVYTDNHTRTFEIRLGHVVSMPRSEVDEDPDNQCSRGLHIGGKGWLRHNYCGTIGLKVLVNPMDVCATPREDNYGKTRTCAYYPIQVIDFNKFGNVDDDEVPDGFEVDFLDKISYTGTINNEDNDNYKLYIPEEIDELDRERAYKNLKSIASSINRKV